MTPEKKRRVATAAGCSPVCSPAWMLCATPESSGLPTQSGKRCEARSASNSALDRVDSRQLRNLGSTAGAEIKSVRSIQQYISSSSS